MVERTLGRFRHDDRAVSPVVGFVLIFALIMIVFTLYQTNVVPAQNTEVEFKHSQAVEADLSNLNDAIKATSADGAPRSQTIATGMQYPSRALAINPGAPVGSLRMGNVREIDLRKVSINGSAYWDKADDSSNGTEPVFNTKPIVYTIDYNEQQSNPLYTIQSGQLFRQYGNSKVLSNGELSEDPIPDKQIDLFLMNGTLQQSGYTTSVTVDQVSTSTESLSVTPTGNTLLKLPTTLSETEAENLIHNGFSASKGKDYAAFRDYTDNPNGPNTVTVKLKPNEEFTFRITKIGFGSVDKAGPHEIVPTEETIGPDTPTVRRNVSVNESTSFTVVVRDRFGNPVSDGTVESSSSATNVTPSSTTTNDEGKATFTYTPETTGTKTATITSNEVSYNATYEFNVTERESESDDGYSPGPPPIKNVSGLTSTSVISFDINPKSSLNITGFAIETRYDLSNLTETNATHDFEISQRTPHLTDTSNNPIQFDGRKYTFASPDEAKPVTNSHIQIDSFPQQWRYPDIVLEDFVDSPREADLIVWFILEDGSEMPVYISGHIE